MSSEIPVKTLRISIFTILLLVLAPAALAQAADPPSPLSGPTVKERPATPGLERTFEGKTKPMDRRPEVAALDTLTLSDEERAQVGGVLVRREATMQRLIRENIDLLLRAQAVREGNDPDAKRALMEDMREAFSDLAKDGTLAEQIAAALSPDNAAKFNEMNKEYWRALIKAPKDDAAKDRRAAARAALQVLGQEVRQAYERMIAEGKESLDRVIADLELSAEQEDRVRALVAEFGQKTKLNPTPKARVALFGEIAKELTPEQRRRAFDLFAPQ